MIIEMYKYKTHGHLLEQILVKRNMNPNLCFDLPRRGYVAIKDYKIIAAGFLRMIEGNHAMLDSHITDPDASSELRDQALDLIVETLLNYAKDQDIQSVMSFTKDKNTAVRAQDHGLLRIEGHTFNIISLK